MGSRLGEKNSFGLSPRSGYIRAAMTTRGQRGGRGPVQGRRRGHPPLPSLPNAHQKQNHKYTIKEVDVILDALGHYRTNAPAREWLRREGGLQVSLDTLIHYRES